MMKDYVTTLIFYFSRKNFESMNYQAVIRNGSGDLVTSQQVGYELNYYRGITGIVFMKKPIRLPPIPMAW